MLLTKIEKRILKSAKDISIANLHSDFESEMMFLKRKFLEIVKIAEFDGIDGIDGIEKYLIKKFSELEINNFKKKVDFVEQYETKDYYLEVDIIFKKEYLSFKFLFNLLLEKEVRIKSIEKKQLLTNKMNQDEHFNLLYSIINKSLKKENFSQKSNNLSENDNTNKSLENLNENNNTNENLDDIYDDEQDNFFYSYDADDVDDNYDGAEFDNYD